MGQAGLRVNMVPKDGGNNFHGVVFGNYTHEPWQGSNLRSNLTSRGITNVSKVQKIWDVNPAFGGPIRSE